MNVVKSSWAFVLALSLMGCASTGVRVTEDQARQFEKGQTTYTEVVRALGQPTFSTLLPNGERQVGYSYSSFRTRPETFIPYVGAFIGGGDTRFSTVLFTFDAQNVLRDFTSTNMQTGTQLGTAPGGRVVDQPR